MTEPAASYRSLLAATDVRALLAATCLSRLSSRMLSLTIVLYALARFASPALAGWLTFAAVAPGLVISPVSGALLDRAGATWAITVDMAASATLIMALVVLDRLGWSSPLLMLALVAMFSLTSPLSAAGIRTLLPRLVSADALDRANALDTAIHGLVDVVGPASAGMLAGFAGPASALAVIALGYAAAAACLTGVRRAPRPVPEPGSLLHHSLQGMWIVVHQPTLRGLAASYALYEVTWGILAIAVPVSVARSVPTGGTDLVVGLLWAAAGVAGGIGALLAGQLRTTGRERSTMVVGMSVTALAAWPVAAASGLPGLAIGLAFVGLAAGPIDVGLLTLRQRRTDPAQLGRSLAISTSLNVIGFPVGSALGGMLAGRSLAATFILAAIASALAAFAMRLVPADDPAERT